jgi:hypothetical protein
VGVNVGVLPVKPETVTPKVIVPPSKVADPGAFVITTADESATAQLAVMLVGCAGLAGLEPVLAIHVNSAAAPLTVIVKLFPDPATIVCAPVVPSPRTTCELLSISALSVCVPAVVVYGITHPELHEVLVPAAVVTLSMKIAACAVADEMNCGRRARLEVLGGPVIVRSPDAGSPACAGGAPLVPPPPAQPASIAVAIKISGIVRRFMMHPPRGESDRSLHRRSFADNRKTAGTKRDPLPAGLLNDIIFGQRPYCLRLEARGRLLNGPFTTA